MHGPSISDPTRIDERAIPENDVLAYQAAGWVVGGKPEDKTEAEAETKPAAKTAPKAAKGKPKK